MISDYDISQTFNKSVTSSLKSNYDYQRLIDTYKNVYEIVNSHYINNCLLPCTDGLFRISDLSHGKVLEGLQFLIHDRNVTIVPLPDQDLYTITSQIMNLVPSNDYLSGEAIMNRINIKMPTSCVINYNVSYIPSSFMTNPLGDKIAISWLAHEVAVEIISHPYRRIKRNNSLLSDLFKIALLVLGFILLLWVIKYLFDKVDSNKIQSNSPYSRNVSTTSTLKEGVEVDDIYRMQLDEQ